MTDHDGEGVLHSIDCIVDEWCLTLPDEQKASLKAALYQREDTMADALRELGRMYGLYPEIVAQAITNEARLGTPKDETTRSFIHAQYLARMAWLRDQQQGN